MKHEATGLSVLLVDDHGLMRMGIRSMLEASRLTYSIQEASDARQALVALKLEEADIALVDITMPGRSGIELVREITRLGYKTRCIVLSMHEASLYVDDAVEAGAWGYVMKHEASELVVEAIQSVMQGKAFVRRATYAPNVQHLGLPASASAPTVQLTPREKELLRLFGQGLTTLQIANEISRSAKTVEAHRANLKLKLGLDSHSDFVAYAVRWSNK
jgi:two-component system, NarL family, response regulator NreC